MYQTLFIVLIAVIALVLAWNVYRSSQFPSSQKHSSMRRHGYKHWVGHYDREPYHAVSCKGDCDALRGLRGRRFLVKDAPPLPVPSCRAERCHCHYEHHHDRRRRRGDRRDNVGLRNELYQLDRDRNRRRIVGGRRRSDAAPGSMQTA